MTCSFSGSEFSCTSRSTRGTVAVSRHRNNRIMTSAATATPAMPSGLRHQHSAYNACGVPAASAFSPTARLSVASSRGKMSEVLEAAVPQLLGPQARAIRAPALPRTAARQAMSSRHGLEVTAMSAVPERTFTHAHEGGSRAVVIGGSVAGLLTAAVSAPFFDEVLQTRTLPPSSSHVPHVAVVVRGHTWWIRCMFML